MQRSLDLLRKEIVAHRRLAESGRDKLNANEASRLLLSGQTTGIAAASLQKMINDIVV